MAALIRSRWLILSILLVTLSAATFAQEVTAEPVPGIDIPVTEMFSYLGTWITTFAPVVLFLGMIPVALALLRYVLAMFQKAFGGGK